MRSCSFSSLRMGYSAIPFALTCPVRFASSSVNYYKRLGIETDATLEEVKSAYRRLALKWHPDVVADTQRAEAEVQFRGVSEAYEILSDPAARRKHDDTLGVKTARKPKPSPTMKQSEAEKATKAPKGVPCEPITNKATHKKWGKKSFLRKDADRAFSDAFEGKTLDEILFHIEMKRRMEQTKSEESRKPQSREETMKRVMEEASVNFGERAAKQYGHGILQHIKAVRHTGPSPPPGKHMPFRPFPGTPVPEGVTFVEDPKMGPTCNVTDADKVDDATLRDAYQEHYEANCQNAFRTPVEDLQKAEAEQRNVILERLEHNKKKFPHNMGQLYSYHRPY
ncbi:DnaJ chaperone protein [Angomonas deanei]|nr:DnaJ chaperone protein [Angomonas deanei]|eukprot:EPY34108.1 DnaJ chaperone protein [Angomonas deanei]